MGFLGFFNYNKPGPGVDKDVYEPPMRVFFGVLGRKFWKICELGLMYSVCMIPLWFLFFIPTLFFGEADILQKYNAQIMVYMFISVVGIPFINPGCAYILRNFSRQSHAWLWHDFFEQIKKNFRQSILIFLIDLAVVLICFVNIGFYSALKSTSIIFTISKTIVFMFMLIYFMMHYFIYTIMVTFDMKLKYILKNALILTFVKLPRNFGIALLLYVIGALLFNFGSAVGVLASILFFSIFACYIVTFNAVSLVDKYLMPFDDDDGEDGEESCFSDERIIADDSTKQVK